MNRNEVQREIISCKNDRVHSLLKEKLISKGLKSKMLSLYTDIKIYYDKRIEIELFAKYRKFIFKFNETPLQVFWIQFLWQKKKSFLIIFSNFRETFQSPSDISFFFFYTNLLPRHNPSNESPPPSKIIQL